MRVLLVEDDVALSEAVCAYLRAKAFVVDAVPSLAQASAALFGAQYAAVLLDLHLGDGDGLSLLPQVRALKDRPIVIVLTARDQVTDRIRGLDAGADDYLVKPYDPGELLARLRAVERRRSTANAPVLVLGNLQIDLGREVVRNHGIPVTLTQKEWALLRVMATRPDRITPARACRTPFTASTTRPTATRWKSSSAGCAASSAVRTSRPCADWAIGW